jgi:hypothetical protein
MIMIYFNAQTMNKILTSLVLFFCFNIFFAAEPTGPPPPPTPPPPPGLPINLSLIVLFFVALLLGYYLSKKYILLNKGSL